MVRAFSLASLSHVATVKQCMLSYLASLATAGRPAQAEPTVVPLPSVVDVLVKEGVDVILHTLSIRPKIDVEHSKEVTLNYQPYSIIITQESIGEQQTLENAGSTNRSSQAPQSGHRDYKFSHQAFPESAIWLSLES